MTWSRAGRFSWLGLPPMERPTRGAEAGTDDTRRGAGYCGVAAPHTQKTPPGAWCEAPGEGGAVEPHGRALVGGFMCVGKWG